MLGIGFTMPAAAQSPPDSQRVRSDSSSQRPAGLDRIRQRIEQIRRTPQQWRRERAPSSARASSPPPSTQTRSGPSRRQLEARLQRILAALLAERPPLYRDGLVYVPLQPSVVPPRPSSAPDTVRLPGDTVRLSPDTVRTVRDTLRELRIQRIERTLLDEEVFRAFEVNFAFGTSTLQPRATRTLNAVGTVLARYPNLRVEIGGHTDAIGTDAFNQRLSRARAAAVRRYLIDRFDLAPGRLVARGYGETQPVESNERAAGRALNRRVEFRVLSSGTTLPE